MEGDCPLRGRLLRALQLRQGPAQLHAGKTHNFAPDKTHHHLAAQCSRTRVLYLYVLYPCVYTLDAGRNHTHHTNITIRITLTDSTADSECGR
jgi:hypothetical protein